MEIIIIGFLILIITIIKKEDTQPNDQNKTKEEYTNIKKHIKFNNRNLTHGEQKVVNTITRELDHKNYFIFNNIILKLKNNSTSQIDHIIVSKYGIFVIESKDLNGTILGDKDRLNWTQLFPGGNKFLFQNPIKQNQYHVTALKQFISYPEQIFNNIVVFTGNANILTEKIENILQLDKLTDYIKKFNQIKLSDNQVQFAVGKLSYICQTNTITENEHISNVQKNSNYQSLNNFNNKQLN